MDAWVGAAGWPVCCPTSSSKGPGKSMRSRAGGVMGPPGLTTLGDLPAPREASWGPGTARNLGGLFPWGLLPPVSHQ